MLSKSFVPAECEGRIYAMWEAAGLFYADPDAQGEAFSIMFPPPNVTGSLHFGHALNFVLQDILIRSQRMAGRNVLWQPGTDHAGIATQMVVERALDAEGLKRQEIGREAFLQRVWDWRKQFGGRIIHQLRELGASADWRRERFTMDEGLSHAVRRVFVSLYNEGLIYRDKRLVNWDPHFKSAVSDLEVENREANGSMWYIRYPLKDSGTIVVATTRPETMLGDVAIAVHPDDERYRHLVGKTVILPLVGREIPIIADAYSDPEKGTGAVKITPAHDFNDFEVGKRHDLRAITVFDDGACIDLSEIAQELNDIAGVASEKFVRELAGSSREVARTKIVDELNRLDLIDKIVPHRLSVPHAERGGAIIEPRLTTQWYCDAKALAEPAIAAVEKGEIRFEPKQWENTYFAWMRDLQPWCISRQLWWGHQIPAWHGPDGAIFVAYDEEEARSLARKKYHEDVPLTRDPDVLDTWFSSALWPFSTLGWPEKTRELARYYPTSVLVTGFDIIFFWVARMMMMGLHFMKEVPFHTVVIHGLVRDERGQKMSKSKGNGLDPLDLVHEYGTDATRMAICALTGPGRDIRFGKKRVEDYRTFITKLWNAARFCEMNGVKPQADFDPRKVEHPLAQWILLETSNTITQAEEALKNYRFDDYASCCYRFVWNRFCDWYLELAKPLFALENHAASHEIRAVSAYLLGVIFRLLHPIIPFVTEELWRAFAFDGMIAQSQWPELSGIDGFSKSHNEIAWLMRLIGEVRTLRAEMNVPPSTRITLLLLDANAETIRRTKVWQESIAHLARVESISALTGPIPSYAALGVLDEATLIIPLEGLIDLQAERARLAKEITRLERELEKINKKLTDPAFMERAKPEIVAENQERRATFEGEYERLSAALKRLQNVDA